MRLTRLSGGHRRHRDRDTRASERPAAPRATLQAQAPAPAPAQAQALEPRRLLSAAFLDPSFGNGGRVSDTVFGGAEEFFDVAVQRDGKIIAVGTDDRGGRATVIRYDRHGVRDDTFGSNGVAQSDAVAMYNHVGGGLLQPDGKVVVAGLTARLPGDYDMAVGRFNSDGTPDTTFGTGGAVTIRTGATDIPTGSAAEVLLQRDRKLVVVAAETYNSGLPVARLNGDGTPDATFGTNGLARSTFFGRATVNAAAVQDDGKILIAGTSGTGAFLVRLLPDGRPDASFGGGNGFVVSHGDRFNAVLVLPGGAILAGGTDGYGLTLDRFDPAGERDRSFGNGGHLVYDLEPSSPEGVAAMRLRSDGTVVAVGYGGDQVREDSFFVWKFNQDGLPDGGFNDGNRFEPRRAFEAEQMRALAIQPDGAIVTAGAFGFFGGNFALARVVGDDPDPQPADPDLSPDGTLTVAGTDAADAVSIDYRSNSLVVTVNGGQRTYDAALVRRVDVFGGGGDDALTVLNAPPVRFDGGTGADALTYHGGNFSDQFDFSPTGFGRNRQAAADYVNVERVRVNGGGGEDSFRGSLSRHMARLTLDGGDGRDWFVDHERVFNVTPGPVAVLGGAGDDMIDVRGNGASDTVDAGAGTDEVTADGIDTVTNAEVLRNTSITGRVFNDLDGDGAIDSGDTGLQDWYVFIDSDGDGVFDSGESSTTTSHDGAFDLGPLRAGAYPVRTVLVNGWDRTNPSNGRRTVTLVSGQDRTGVNFGNRRPAGSTGTISGTVFDDTDGDGVRDANESTWMMPRLYLDVDGDGTRDANEEALFGDYQTGNYRFTRLAAGTHRVRPDYLYPGAFRATNVPYHDVTLTAGGSATGKDFGLSRTALLSGVVYHDADADGTRDAGEAGIAGRVVYLDVNRDGMRHPLEPFRETDADGVYTFAGIASGSHVVRVAPAAGWRTTSPAGGGRDLYLEQAQEVTDAHFGQATARASSVVGRHVFYNNSAFDGNDAAATAADDATVATGKAALLPGAAASFANVTSYTKGINGIMIDLSGLPPGATAGPAALSVADFVFHIGSPAAGWLHLLPPSSITVRPGAGVAGSDRVTVIWPDGTIRNTWLRVTVKPNDRTALSEPDVFYFGNAPGESGDSATSVRVSALDLAAVRRANNSAATLATGVDFNRDGRVNALDLAAVRGSLSRELQLFTAPAVLP